MNGRPPPASLALGPVDNFIGYRLRRAWNEVRRDFEAELGPIGITRGTIGLLSVVQANPGIAQGVAARLLDIQRANMVSLVAELADAGWIVKSEELSDRRSVVLSLTAEGERVFGHALARVKIHEERMFGGLNAESRSQLVEMLGKVGRARAKGK